jgi:glyoxylase-like metal-dependent hydrolase (beta-lactamase superfamily II)
MKIYQILEGLHDHFVNESGNKQLPGHTGSVTLIESASGRILIDTGSRAAWPKVKTNLANLGIKPEDIDFVLLTHLHLDHSFNVAHFTKARLFAWALEWTENETIELGPDLNTTALSEVVSRITAIRTPGHDECMNSFFVTNAESLTLINKDVINLTGKKLAISGDAINLQVIESKGQTLPYTYDRELFKHSAQKILDQNPDFIMPGHGTLIVRPKSNLPKVS